MTFIVTAESGGRVIRVPTGGSGPPAMPSVRDHGALSDGTDSRLAFEATNAAESVVRVPPGTFTLATTPTLTKPLEIEYGSVLTGAGAAGTGFAAKGGRQTIQPTTTADEFSTRYIRRNANHFGGTAGFASAGLRVDSYVGSGVTNYEWAGVFTLDNSAAAGQNVAVYFKATKRSTGPTWGAVAEVIDLTTNPTSGTVGQELDVSCNGTDNNFARVGFDLVVRKFDPAGADAVASWGYRVQNGGNANSLIKTGYGFASGTKTEVAFDASTAINSIGAFKTTTNVPIIFSADNTKKLSHTGGAWSFLVSGTQAAAIADTGAYYVGANQVVGARVTGTPAAATDLASAITLINFLRAAGLSHGAIA